MFKRDRVSSMLNKAKALSASVIIIASCLCDSFALTASANIKELDRASYCSFLIPEGFYPCETKGLYINEHYPLESASISYSVTDIPQDAILTNAEKAAGKDPSATDEELLYDELTKEMYEEIQIENYKELYGDNIDFTVENFEEYLFDNYPGYRISTRFTPEGSQTIYQDITMILSSNKIFTIVYARAEDDDFAAAFEESKNTIHVKNDR